MKKTVMLEATTTKNSSTQDEKQKNLETMVKHGEILSNVLIENLLLISLYRYQVYHCNRYHASAAIGTVRIAANGTMIIGSA